MMTATWHGVSSIRILADYYLNFIDSKKLQCSCFLALTGGYQQKDFIQSHHNCHLADSDYKMSSTVRIIPVPKGLNV